MSAERSGLVLSDNLRLPLDFATKTAAILAQRRKGKTYTASVLAEEMVSARQPFVALDPTGAWWGLRASADGKDAGLPVVVLGGQHGDVPLERTGGRLVADLVVEEPGYYVIDFSLFESGEAERQFAVDFAERLYRAKGQPGRDFPLHLFVDEADRFIPQQIRKGSNETSARLLGAFEAIVRRGGLRGIGTTLVSQRAAVVNKNVLEMIDILFVLRTVGPNDRDAIDGYIKAHGTSTERAAMLDSLASLDIGEAWVWEPGADPPLFERVRIRRRRTYNSSATPEPGKKRVEPKRLASVDLAALRNRMAATLEKAKADDPRELRKRIAELERQAKAQGPPAAPPKRVEVPVIRPEQLDRLQRLEARSSALAGQLAVLAGQAQEAAQALRAALAQARPTAQAAPRPPAQAPSAQPERPSRRPEYSGLDIGPTGLPAGERAVLQASAQYAGALERDQASVVTGYKRSTRDAYIARLRERGYLLVDAAGRLQATREGIAALGTGFEPLPTGDALQRYWLDRLPEGEGQILGLALAAYPKSVDRAAIEESTGYRRSTRDAYISRLQSRQLLLKRSGPIAASPSLFT